MGLLIGLLSPTRACARWLIDSNYIQNFRTMMVWNVAFYFTAIITCVVVNARPSLITIWGAYSIAAFVYLCLWRVNELLFAFYGDALPKRAQRTHKSLPIERRDRIILLTLAYLEIIIWFGLIYWALQFAYGEEHPFNARLRSILDAIFVSGVTLTSLGSSQFYAVQPLSRLATLYEAMIGIVFIALGLAAYIGASDQNQNSSPPPTA